MTALIARLTSTKSEDHVDPAFAARMDQIASERNRPSETKGTLFNQ